MALLIVALLIIGCIALVNRTGYTIFDPNHGLLAKIMDAAGTGNYRSAGTNFGTLVALAIVILWIASVVLCWLFSAITG